LHVLVDLIVREALTIGLLAALGSGVATFLPRTLPVSSRIALSPPLGLSVSAAACMTAVLVIPGKVAAWLVLVPLTLGSLAIAVLRLRVRDTPRLHAREVLPVVIVIVGAVAVMNVPLLARDSLGPIGYTVGDANGYVAADIGLRENALRDHDWGPAWDLTAGYGRGYADGFQQLGPDAVQATIAELFGWLASESHSALLVAFIAAGAVGLFGVANGLFPGRWPFALLAGLLYLGPVEYQLFIDGSGGALAGLALVGPFALLSWCAVRSLDASAVLLLGLVAAGVQTLYPLFVPILALAVAMVVVCFGIRAGWRREGDRGRVLRVATALGGLVFVAAALSPVAMERNVDYWIHVASSDTRKALTTGLPRYDLAAQVIPGWILGTREFYFLPRLGGSLKEWAAGAVAPVALVVVAVVGAYRFAAARFVVVLVPAAALLAIYSYGETRCSYCVQRNLLPLAPVGALLVAAGTAALWSFQRTWTKAVAAAVAVLTLTAVGHKSSVVARRANDGAYMLPASFRAVSEALGDRRGPILIEGAGATFAAPFELPSIYNAINERTAERLAINPEIDDYRGLLYLGGTRPLTSEYTSAYRLVLSRLAGIRTDRSTILRRGPFAVQRRAGVVDVAVAGGVAADGDEYDLAGIAWVQGPMTFWVSALTSRPVWLRLVLTGPQAASVRPSGAVPVRRVLGAATLCVPVAGRGTLRRVIVPVALKPMADGPPRRLFDLRPPPTRGLRLSEMRASSVPCLRG